MPARRFIGYFLALAACSTFAFASFGPDEDAPQESTASAAYPDAVTPPDPLLFLPYSPGRRHKVMRAHLPAASTQVASAIVK